MKSATNFLLLIFILIKAPVFSQEYYAPLDFRLLLSGTFGELRANHFHTGIDIKTEGVEGQKVYAIDKGYISRIKISSWGYGKAIYINHPNGKTSVYAHLQKLSDKIEDIVKKEHYKREQFEINFFPKKDAIMINKGEIIALSGNSGGSNGAHLHFEIRDTKTEHPINPLKFDFLIDDNIAPTLKKIKIYAFDTTLINNKRKSKIIKIENEKNAYFIKDNLIINGAFGLGIFTYDKLNDSHNKNGVYSIELFIDSVIHYAFKVDELDFSTKRYINAHIDYCEHKVSNNKYHRCYKLPHNKLNNYSDVVNNGIISFKDNNIHLITILVSDIAGNTSILNFNVQSNNKPFDRDEEYLESNHSANFRLSSPNIFKTDNLQLYMHANSLYEPLKFHYNITDTINEVYGSIHHVHNNTIPVHKRYTLSIKANIPNELKEKTYIASTNMQGTYKYLGGNWQEGFLRAKIREFGNFCIVADTISPVIKAINIVNGKVLKTQNNIKCTIKDIDSGIKSFRGEINGNWILMDYDYKRSLLKYDIDSDLEKGTHIFTLEVVDNVGNISNYKAKFTY